MFQRALSPLPGSGGGTIVLIAWAKSGTTSWSYYDADTDYVDVSTDRRTLTFKKGCKGFIGANDETLSGTATITEIANAQGTYTDKLYEFEATVGQTIIFTHGSSWGGYEVIGI